MTDQAATPDRTSDQHEPVVRWDAGDIGCGELIIELKLRLRALADDEVVELVAHDPGAREDIPAWCRLTGNRLLSADHPTYLIQRHRS